MCNDWSLPAESAATECWCQLLIAGWTGDKVRGAGLAEIFGTFCEIVGRKLDRRFYRKWSKYICVCICICVCLYLPVLVLEQSTTHCSMIIVGSHPVFSWPWRTFTSTTWCINWRRSGTMMHLPSFLPWSHSSQRSRAILTLPSTFQHGRIPLDRLTSLS